MHRTRLREAAKLALRSHVGRAGLSVGRDPFASRVVRSLRARQVTTTVDVGANEGQYAALLRAAGFRGRVISYEPVREAYERLAARAARATEWDTVHAGTGARSGSTQINVSANSYSSSMLPITPVHVRVDPASAYERTETVRMVTVDEEVDRLGIDPASTLLKVDTQGFEGPTLQGAATTLSRVAAVQLELSVVEVYEGQALAPELTDMMRSAGLEPWSFDPGISDHEGRLLQYDALFVRP